MWVYNRNTQLLLWLVVARVATDCDPSSCVCSNQICLSCLSPSSYLSQQGCLPCDYRCRSCTSPNQCTLCEPNYTLETSCTPCPLFCRSCSKGCSVCIDGYVLVNGSCLECTVPYAATCTSLNDVLDCIVGYWENGDSCAVCREFCIKCTSSSNCLLCQPTFYIASSSGTYCKPCGTACHTCTATTCLACLPNYSLSPTATCTPLQCQLPNCLACTPANLCSVCSPSFYLANGACIPGASILCSQAYGPLPSLCSACTPLAYLSLTTCLPRLWISALTQFYYNAFSATPIGTKTQACSTTLITNVAFTHSFTPYYKLILLIKAIGPISITMNDGINSYFAQSNCSATPCVYCYWNISSKNINLQKVTLSIRNGSVSQLLIQVLRCSSDCVVCYNTQYCQQCIPSLFALNLQCVQSCEGYLQLYLPNGDSSLYTSKQCVLTCPPSFYPSTTLCLPCTSPCSTCLSGTQCFSCLAPYLFYNGNFSCLQQCPPTHYPSVVCVPCLAPCSTCLNATYCLSCFIGYYSKGQCVTQCPPTTYNTNSMCSACDPKCQACAFTPTYCSSCTPPYLLYSTTCLSACPALTTYSMNGACLNCQLPCSQCTTRTSCLSCAVGSLYQNTCADCPAGFYSVNRVCVPCINNCFTCTEDNSCLSCTNPTSLYLYQCLASCPPQYYSAKAVCVQCAVPCLTCTALLCTSCLTGVLSAVSGQCGPSCDPGYYPKDSLCLKCPSPCRTCLATACLSCTPPLLLQATSCLPFCNAGYYPANYTCLQCTYPCSQCNLANCLACVSPFFIYSGQCVTQCPPSTYYSNAMCAACVLPCVTCQSPTLCTSCAPTLYLHSNNCLQSCPASTYADAPNCIDCLFPCSTCIAAPTRCLSCTVGYYYNFTCANCPVGTYPQRNACVSCSVANCALCTEQSVCIQCKNPFLLLNQSCVSLEQCGSATAMFPNVRSGQCVACLLPCVSCFNYTSCKSCVAGYMLQEEACLLLCSDRYYPNGSQCILCSTKCLTCTNSNTCRSCPASTILLVTSSTCVSTAICTGMQGYFVDGSQCMQCVPPCLLCLSLTSCLSCTVGVLFNKGCSFSCPSHYYTDSLGVCLLCDSQCVECTSTPTRCTSCNTPNILQNSTCVTKCSLSYYLSVNECLPCLSPCLTCSTPVFCLSCSTSLILYGGQCLNSCPLTYYYDGKQCVRCGTGCDECNSTTCLACSVSLYMSSTQGCKAGCESAEYASVATRQCYPCISPCLTCSSPLNCLTCIQPYLLSSGQCLKHCPIDQYLLQLTCVPQCPLYTHKALCVSLCPNLYANQFCVDVCPEGYYLAMENVCRACGPCGSLLTPALTTFTLYNTLFLKITFNLPVSLKANITLFIAQNQVYAPSNTPFTLSSIHSYSITFQMTVNKSLRNAQIKIVFSSYYALNQVLQSKEYQTSPFDYEYYGEVQMNTFYTLLGQLICLTVFGVFIVNVILNIGFMSYMAIDYLQYLTLFPLLSMNLTPELNQFLYGLNSIKDLKIAVIFGSIIYAIILLLLILQKLISSWLMHCKRSNRIVDSQHKKQLSQDTIKTTTQNKNSNCITWIRNRFKWNHINDVVYVIYFYVTTAALTITTTITQQPFLSFIAIFCIVIALIFPIILFLKLYRMRDDIKMTFYNHAHQNLDEQSSISLKITSQTSKENKEQQSVEDILVQYRTFLAIEKCRVAISYYNIPLRYAFKFLMSLCFSYFLPYPFMCLSTLLCFTVLDNLLLSYKLHIVYYVFCITNSLYFVCFFMVGILQYVTIIAFGPIILWLFICLFAIVVLLQLCFLGVEIVGKGKGIDYFKLWEVNQFQETRIKSSRTNLSTVNIQNKQISLEQNEVENSEEEGKERKENSNEMTSKAKEEIKTIEEDSESDGFDLYLKKESNAPQILIKCKNIQLEKEVHNKIKGQTVEQNKQMSQVQESIFEDKNKNILVFQDFDEQQKEE